MMQLKPVYSFQASTLESTLMLGVNGPIGSVYTRRQRECSDNSAMTLQNGIATHFQVSPLISMRTESVASSQSGHSIDTDA